MQLSVASFVEIQLTSLLGKGNRWLVDCKALLCFTVWLFFDFTAFKVYWLHITFSVLHNKLRKQFNDIGRLYEIKFQNIVGNIGLKLKTILKVCALPLHHFQNTWIFKVAHLSQMECLYNVKQVFTRASLITLHPLHTLIRIPIYTDSIIMKKYL